jgi:hypothetical protein
MVPVEVGGDVVLEMVLSTYAPLSYVKDDIVDALVRLGFAEFDGNNRYRLQNVSIHRQSLPDLSVRARPTRIGDVDGALGLDFMNRFTDIHYHVPSLQLTLTEL